MTIKRINSSIHDFKLARPMRSKILTVTLAIIILASTFLLTPSTLAWRDRYTWVRERELIIVAVSESDSGYIGVTANLTVRVCYPGSGELYFSADPLTMIDMQGSARTAFMVACSLFKLNPLLYDVFVRVESNSLIVGGPSAGAALTVAMASALADLPVNESVIITGMINPDGTIGPVGGIPEKLEAASSSGAKVFLIPRGQRIAYRERIVVERGPFWITRRVVRERVDVYEEGERLGIKVIEVATISDALGWFTGYTLPTPPIEEEPYIPPEILGIMENWTYSFLNNYTEISREAYSRLGEVPWLWRGSIRSILNEAEVHSNNAISLLNEGLPYPASSEALQACIKADYALSIIDYIGNENSIVELGSRVNDTLKNVYYEAFKAEAHGILGFEALTAARLRYYMAYNYFLKSLKYYEEESYDDSLYYLILAKWRLITVKEWLTLNNLAVEQSPSIEGMRGLAGTLLYEAESTVSYVTTLAQDLGSSIDEVSQMMEYMDIARDAYERGDSFGSIGASAYAIAIATTIIHKMFGTDTSEMVSTIESSTLEILSEDDIEGKAVLALSYYQQSSIEKDVTTKLLFLELAGFHARISLMAVSIGSSQNQGVQVEPFKAPTPPWTRESGGNEARSIVELLVTMSLGMIIGGLIVLVIILLRRKSSYI